MAKKAAVMAGDGIGPELVECMEGVLRECNLQAELIRCEAGSEQWERGGRRDGSYIPDSTSTLLTESDACFKGPTTTIPDPGMPRSVAVTLRQRFELYANIRPCRTYRRLSDKRLECVCFREATEGLYAGIEARITDDAAIAIRKVTRPGCRRLARMAFEWAQEHHMKKVVAITKRNILRQTDGIFWEEMQAEAAGSPEIKLSEIYIDNMAQQLLVATSDYDGAVLVSTNLFMDIISELASGLVGSIGLIYSANMGDNFAMFEAAHGSAPSLAGKNTANPVATILSGAWMARYLGESDVAEAVFAATHKVVEEGKFVTADIGGSAGTIQMTQEISRLAKLSLHR